MSKKKSFADEMLDLLDARAPKEVADEEDEGREGDDWEEELLGAVGVEGGLRMRGDLGGAFTEGKYKGRVVGAGDAFDKTHGLEEAEFDDDDEEEEEDEEDDAEQPTNQKPPKTDLDYGSDYSSTDSLDRLIEDPDGAINEAAISAKMDDIFAGLDDDGLSEAEGETYEAFLTKEKVKPKKRVLKRNREDYQTDDEMGSEGEDDEIARQIAEVKAATEKSQKEVMKVVETDTEKSLATRNQYKIWGKLVACRIHMQQPMSQATLFPEHYASEYFSHPEISSSLQEVKHSLASILDELHDLRTSMLAQNPVCKSSASLPVPKDRTTPKGPNLNKYWRLCVSSSSLVSSKLDDIIDQWHSRTQLTSSQSAEASLKAASTSAVKQVQQTLEKEHDRLTKKCQKNRTGKLPFGHPGQEEVAKDPKLIQTPEYLHNENIYDDSDFYSWLLTDYMHSCSDSSLSNAVDLADAQRQAKDPSRLLIDKRRSKARKLNFQPHPKLVGYAAPDPQDVPTMVDALYRTLFATA